MDADRSRSQDVHWAWLRVQHLAPERSGLVALTAVPAAVAAAGLALACCSADCPKEQAAQFEWFSVRCLPFPLSGDPDSQDDKCAA